jgi:hypothetical protein
MSVVVDVREWPKRCDTTGIGTPAWIRYVALAWRRSWNLTWPTLASRMMRFHVRLQATGINRLANSIREDCAIVMATRRGRTKLQSLFSFGCSVLSEQVDGEVAKVNQACRACRLGTRNSETEVLPIDVVATGAGAARPGASLSGRRVAPRVPREWYQQP